MRVWLPSFIRTTRSRITSPPIPIVRDLGSPIGRIPREHAAEILQLFNGDRLAARRAVLDVLAADLEHEEYWLSVAQCLRF